MFINQTTSDMSSSIASSSDAGRSSAFRFRVRANQWRLLVMMMLVLPTMSLAGWSMYEIFKPNGLTALEMMQLGLSIILFAWLSMSFWTAVIGFVLQLFHLDPLSLRPTLSKPDDSKSLRYRYAVVMPVYNEDTQRIFAGFEACIREILSSNQAEHFDFYMLSDTQDSELAKAEYAGAQRLQRRFSSIGERIFYRRREKNVGRKVGNISDFLQRWGAHYQAMIVLDADSVMSAERMVDLARRMEANPGTALIQTIPMPVRQESLFGRFVQFAAHLYSPMLATGLSFWQTDAANYWGHNAIVRIAPFMACCGLPSLDGKGAWSGDVLSHDFVEAAMLRRAGWQVHLLTDTEGSYEEVPANMIDYATRDRRWVQGNIQHLAMLNITGLKMVNRLHFLFGAFAYISSLVLFAVLLVGSADALIKATTPPVYFPQAYQLFPDWQIARQEIMLLTLWLTLALLFMPKLLGLILACVQRRDEFGGIWRLLFSGVCEMLMAILIAPLMLFFHSYFVLSVLLGHKVSWNAQQREGRMLPFSAGLKPTWWVSCLTLAWALVTFQYTPALFYWLLPVFAGLLFAAPIIWLSSSLILGKLALRCGIFVIPQELTAERSLERLQCALQRHQPPQLLSTPLYQQTELALSMPVQNFTRLPNKIRCETASATLLEI